MSRYEEYEAEYNNAGELWYHNVRQALRGKRGRKALAEFREALLALPEKRLIADALCTVNLPVPRIYVEPASPFEHGIDMEERRRRAEERDEWRNRQLLEKQGRGVCAVGAYVWWQKVKAGADPVAAFADLPLLDSQDSDMSQTADIGKDAGLVGVLAWHLAYMNDEEFPGTPEKRYESFLQWIDEELARV